VRNIYHKNFHQGAVISIMLSVIFYALERWLWCLRFCRCSYGPGNWADGRWKLPAVGPIARCYV